MLDKNHSPEQSVDGWFGSFLSHELRSLTIRS
jgi:hypothetical protein